MKSHRITFCLVHRFALVTVLGLLPAIIFAQEIPSLQKVEKDLDSISKIKNDAVRDSLYVNYVTQPPLMNKYPDKGIAVGDILIEDGKRLGNRHTEINGLLVKGGGYRTIYDQPKAAESFLAALSLAEKSNQQVQREDALINLSQLYSSMNDLALEKKYIEEALEVAKKNNTADTDPILFLRLGISASKRKQFLQAVNYYQKGIAIAQRSKEYDYMRNSMLNNLGQNLTLAGRYTDAIDILKRSESLADSLHNIRSKAYAFSYMASVYDSLNDKASVEKYNLMAIPLAQQSNAIECQMDIYENLHEIYEKEKRFEEALSYFKKWSDLRDDIFTKEKTKQLDELQTKYDAKNKDIKIAAQGTQIAFNKKVNAFLIAGSVLLAAVVVLIYTNLRTSRRYRRQLEELNGVKDRIFSVISHDMRTPVASMLSFMQLLESGDISPEDMKEYSHEIKDSLGYTAELMENLLNWARTQMQGYKPVMERFDVSGAVENVMNLLAPIAQAKKINIQNDIPQASVIYADINMTALLIRNLLSNAIKYTKPGGLIRLSANTDNGYFHVTVEDSGVGINELMVKEFNNKDSGQPIQSTAGTSNEKGTGMGLMLCKNFARLMNGQITLKSEPGKGSRFIVSFMM